MYLVEISPLLGIATAIITQAVKAIPWFDSKKKKQWLAFGVSVILVAVAAYREQKLVGVEVIDVIGSIGGTLATAYALYQAVKPKDQE
jgi:DMSO reductase anchor subunit